MNNIPKMIKAFGYKYRYWLFAIIAGFTVAILEEVLVEPYFSMTAFVYWSLLFFWAFRWFFRLIKQIIKQQKEKKNMELLHLQSQVNPHFFFNTLNNLYGMVEKDSTKAREMILKLSDMMRYSIYDGQKNHVTLEEEINFIQSYISLHTSRYHKTTDIQFTKDIAIEGINIMPLLFINLLENAFKHGVEKSRKNAFVKITLNANEKEINFIITNNFDKDEVSDDQGVGLNNLKRRLEIGYPKKHVLKISAEQETFSAHLTLQLK